MIVKEFNNMGIIFWGGSFVEWKIVVKLNLGRMIVKEVNNMRSIFWEGLLIELKIVGELNMGENDC